MGDNFFKSYYAIIPANVRYDKALSANAKLLYGEITALCNERGYCWAGNDYFAKLYSVSKTSISKWISQLVKQKYLCLDIEYKENTKQILHRYLRISPLPIEEKFNRSTTKINDPIEEKLNRGIEEKLKDNTTFNNTTLNNTIDNNTSKRKIQWDKILIAWNDLPNPIKPIKAITDRRKDKIKARINSLTLTQEDIIQAISNIKKSSFLQGKNNRNWIIDINWLFQDDTRFCKVLEGKYNDKEGGNNDPPKHKKGLDESGLGFHF